MKTQQKMTGALASDAFRYRKVSEGWAHVELETVESFSLRDARSREGAYVNVAISNSISR